MTGRNKATPLFCTRFSCFSSCFALSHVLVSVAWAQHSTFFIVDAVVSREDAQIDSHVLGLFLFAHFGRQASVPVDQPCRSSGCKSLRHA